MHSIEKTTNNNLFIMKKFILSIAALLMIVSCDTGTRYTIKGKITGNKEELVSGTVYLANRDKNDPVRDSAKMTNGRFTFKGSVKTPDFYYITIPGIHGMVMVFLENAKFTVTGTDSTFSKAEVIGGDAQDKWNQYMKLSENLSEKYGSQKLMMEMRNPKTTEERREEIYKVFDEYQSEFEEGMNAIVAQDPISVFALYVLQSKVSELPIDSVQNLVAEYHRRPEFEGNKYLVKIEEELAKELPLQVGKPCIDFTLGGIKGKQVTFSEIYPKNKVTMIDFWAGWCNPCRMFNPKLLEIYKKYHKSGFEVVGVSLDMSEDRWKAAVKEDRLPWIQVSSLQYWQCPVAKEYNVRFIPQNVFVDGSGTIIARRLNEDEIEPFLQGKLLK